jgi:hypothetical protein
VRAPENACLSGSPDWQKQDFMHQNRLGFVAIVAAKAEFPEKRVQTKRCDSHEARKFRGFTRTD